MSRCVTARITPGSTVALSPTPRLGEPRDRLGRGELDVADVDLDEVRLDEMRVDRRAPVGPALGEPPRPGVVVGEALDVVLERVEAGRRDDPCLPHRAAEAVLLDPRARHQLGRAGDDGAERRAEALREAERDGVEAAPPMTAAATPERDGRVREPRAVEVDSEPELARRVDAARRATRAARPCRRRCCACSRARRSSARGMWKPWIARAAVRICSGESTPRYPGRPRV